jgi:mRNA degradation ribonuclease J1/J2
MTEIAIRTENLTRDFGTVRAVDGLSMEVPSGIIFGFLGPNASGHACGPDLLKIAREIKPEVLIPVHSENSYFYVEKLSGSGIEVKLPEVGGVVKV